MAPSDVSNKAQPFIRFDMNVLNAVKTMRLIISESGRKFEIKSEATY